MPPRRDSLENKPLPGKPLLIHPFPQLLSGEPIAIRGEPSTILVRAVQEFRGEEPVFDLGELGVDLLGEEEVDALAEVLDEADGVFEAGGGADEGEAADAGGDQEGEFLRDHAAHADADDVELAGVGPLEGVEDVEHVERHGGGGVAESGGGGEAHAPVVEDEGAVFGYVRWGRVGEVEGLTLPGGFEGAEAHYPLDGERRRCWWLLNVTGMGEIRGRIGL